MAKTPIEILFDRANMKCVRCSATMGGCDCWEKITLCCPQCKRTMKATKDPSDPKGTVVVQVLCDRCDDGGVFPETHYYDKEGRWFDGERFIKEPHS